MLAKHKVGSSTLLTRSIFKPPVFPGAFLFLVGRGVIDLRSRFHLGCIFFDLIFDEIPVAASLFDVLGIVRF